VLWVRLRRVEPYAPERGNALEKRCSSLWKRGACYFVRCCSTRWAEEAPVSDMAATIIEQFIDLVDPEDPEPGWAMRVLIELSKDPAPVGPYAQSVKDAIIKRLLRE